MPNHETLFEFYGSIVGCPLRCNRIVRDQSLRIPRSFYTEASRGDDVIFCVSQNPAEPSEPDEYYSGGSNANKAERHFAWLEARMRPGAAPRNKLVGKIRPYLAELLGVAEENVFGSVVMTAIVKCQSIDNVVTGEMLSECGNQNFSREIDYWKPTAIVAMGSAAERGLLRAGIRDFVSVLHPTHRKGRLAEAEVLQRARGELKNLGALPG